MVRTCTWLTAAFLVASNGLAQQQTTVFGADGATRQVIVAAPDGQLPPPPPPPFGGTVAVPIGPGGAPGMPARDASAKTGTARIRGRVFAADNGAPIRRAQVRLVSPELRENRLAFTDAQGMYDIKDLPAGRYTLTATKGSFVSLQYGQTRPNEPGRPLQILDAQTVEKVDISLPRGSVLSGRILDEFGEPASDVMVAAMRYQYIQGRRRLMPQGRTSMTNDIGEYRIFGLPPGAYYLSATLRPAGGIMLTETSSDDRSGYAPTYYPGTPSSAEAQRINVPLGQAITDVNMSLVQTRTARITGTAVDASGKPLAGGFLIVMQRTGTMFMGGNGTQIKPDGTFTVSNVAPGDYTLQAQMPGGMPGEMGEFATANVTVAGDDVSGVQLIGMRMIVATGRILVNAEDAKSLQPSAMRIMTAPANPDQMMMGGGGGRINEDFSFELRTRPGVQMIRLQAGLGPSGWMTKAVRYNGVDVTDTGLEFRANEDISGIEIELTNHPGSVSGLVTTVRGEPSKDYTVVVFAQDQQKWGFMSRYLATGRPDQDGRFQIRNLPAGSYYAIALDYLEQGEQTDPEVLEKLRDRGTLFSLNEGETKTLDLKLQANQ